MIYKTIILCSFLFISLINKAQKPDFDQAMKNALEQFGKAGKIEEFQSMANEFLKIAQAVKTRWEPYYYAAHCYIYMANIEVDCEIKDGYLDHAEQILNSGFSLQPDESEIMVLQALLFQTRISVSPFSRGSKFGTMSDEKLTLAMKINPENPRIYYLQGMNAYYIPWFLGGGAKKALPFFIKAREKFNKYNVPSGSILPVWGIKNNEKMILQCQE